MMNLDFLKLVDLRLKSLGHESVLASSAEKDTEVIHEEKPALIILDLKIGAADGLDILKNVRQHEDESIAKIPVIV